MFRISKKESFSKKEAISYRLIGFLIGIVLSGIIIAALGYPVIKTFISLAEGSFGSAIAIRNTISFLIPLSVTALGLSIAFKMRYWNIGGEGQILMGATAAMGVSMIMPASTPGPLMMIAMLLAGFVGGSVWALIPGFFRIHMKTNETLFTLMMNYLAICFVQYLYFELWKDPAKMGFPGIQDIPFKARIPYVSGISLAIVAPLIIVILVFFLIKKTKLGYEIRVVGESEPTAHYAGMNVKKIMFVGVLLSGGIVGIAGAVKLMGSTGTLSSSLGGGAGFTAIVIAWLANLSAPMIIVVSFLIAALEQGAQFIQVRMGVPAAVADIVKGLILMSVLGSEFMLRYKVVVGAHGAKNKLDAIPSDKEEVHHVEPIVETKENAL